MKSSPVLWAQRTRRIPLPWVAAVPLAVFVAYEAATDGLTFATIVLNGLTAAGLYFLVASGFTLIFGLLRVTNLAHGSLYLVGGYVGYTVHERTGSWLLALACAAVFAGLLGTCSSWSCCGASPATRSGSPW